MAKIKKISFVFSNGQFLDWYRLDKPVLSESASRMRWFVKNASGACYTSGKPSVSYSLWLCDYLDEKK